MLAWNDRRPKKWPILFASLIAVAAMASTSKADVLVSSLEDEASISSPATTGFTPASPAQEERSQLVHDTQFNRLALLTTIMFFNPHTPPGSDGGSGGSGGGGGDGGGTTPTGSEAPEPATLLTGLVGSGLLGMYSLMRRRRLA